jgi:Ca2+-binding EF-hand superfamily protein
MTEEELDETLDEIDVDGSGTVDFEGMFHILLLLQN